MGSSGSLSDGLRPQTPNMARKADPADLDDRATGNDTINSRRFLLCPRRDVGLEGGA